MMFGKPLKGKIYLPLPETNVERENGWLEDDFPIGKAFFQGLC